MIKVNIVGFRNGLYADAARTYILGENRKAVNIYAVIIYKAAKEALDAVVDNVRVGDYLSKISKTIESVARKYRVFVLPELTSHNIGAMLQEYPPILNVYLPSFFTKNNIIIPNNLTLAV